ncbi:MAG: PH domain-containing protein, partial [Sphingopyxis sp.]
RRPDAGQAWQRSHRIVALGGLIGAVGATTGGLVAVSFGQDLGWFGPVAGLLIGAGSLFGARFHRWADLGEQVAIRRGAWKPKTTLLPHASVQSVDLKSDFVLRPLGLATLVFGVPGGSSLATHEIPAIPLAAALDLRTRILAARARS